MPNNFKEYYKKAFFKQISYSKDFITKKFFLLLLLFLISFVMFGLYQASFFESNLIMATGIIIAILYLIKRILYKHAYKQIIIILLILLTAYFTAQLYTPIIFEKIGLTNFTNPNNALSDNLITTELSGIVTTISTKLENFSKDQAKDAFNYINELRVENEVKQIVWDEKIYNLALWKAKDMSERGYFDHVDPDGKCIGSYAQNFGLTDYQSSFADNLSSGTNERGSVKGWMESRGHRFNLLFPEHDRGALACYSSNCVFIGHGGNGWGCDTGENGLAFWKNAPKQPGEK